MNYKKIVWMALLVLPFSLQATKPLLKTGLWRAALTIPEAEIPFHFNLIEEKGQYSLELINSEERIKVDEVSVRHDSLIARMPIFDSEFRLHITSKDTMTGVWYNHARKTNKSTPLLAVYGIKERFLSNGKQKNTDVSGIWEASFSPETKDSSKALGQFAQLGEHLSGTFLTPTGDYRYLEGCVQGNDMMLSCFDGAHAFLFKAEYTSDQQLEGTFYSGNSWKEPWVAFRNPSYKLPDPYSLTFLKPGYQKVDFRFPNLTGDTVSLSDSRFQHKVTIIQIMGSWCPNCMDESRFLSEVYKTYQKNGLEIIGLAYEKASTTEQAVANINRLKKRFDIQYTLLLAGSADKAEASKTLPMLNGISSFPTTIIIDKKGMVREIYTGFSGPATGMYYDKYVQDFNIFIAKLLKEK